MGIFDGILLISDLDGTLVFDGKISEENIHAIEYFQNNGGLFTICTGRTHIIDEPFIREIHPNTYTGNVNGALIYDTEKKRAVLEHSFDDDKVRKYMEIILSCFPEHRRISMATPMGMAIFSRLKKVDTGLLDYCARPIYKIVFSQSAEQTMEMANVFKNHPDFDVCRSCEFFFEIMPKGINKGYFVQKMREILGERVHTTVAIGDYDNDIDMIRAADIGVAVSGGDENVLKAADWVAPPVTQHALSWLVGRLEEKIIRSGEI